MYRFYFVLLAIWLLDAHSLFAGGNTDVDIGLGVVSPPCGLRGGDRIEFFVAARNMNDVRQVKFDFSWQPADAVAVVEGDAAGIAEIFIAPGPPQVEGNWAEFGMATFGTGIEGEGILARFGFELASHIRPDIPVDIRVEQLSLGPSSTERDDIRPVQTLVLSNYCDSDALPIARSLFVRPREEIASYSPAPSGRIVDGSSGEVLLSARFLDEKVFLRDQMVTWTIDNRGTAPVYVLAAQEVLQVEPGGTQVGFSQSDARGDAYLLLDAEPGSVFGPSTAELTACSEWEGDTYCNSARITWEGTATAVVSDISTPLPSHLHLKPNYPNPFNAGTTIPFFLPPDQAGKLHLEIVDLTGQIVDVLNVGDLSPGHHQIYWDGRNRSGLSAASGLYFCRLRSGTEQFARPMLLLR